MPSKTARTGTKRNPDEADTRSPKSVSTDDSPGEVKSSSVKANSNENAQPAKSKALDNLRKAARQASGVLSHNEIRHEVFRELVAVEAGEDQRQSIDPQN